jgi:hypothetical protein
VVEGGHVFRFFSYSMNIFRHRRCGCVAHETVIVDQEYVKFVALKRAFQSSIVPVCETIHQAGD